MSPAKHDLLAGIAFTVAFVVLACLLSVMEGAVR